LGEGIYCHDLLADLQKKISMMCLAELFEDCKNTHANKAVTEIQKALQVTFE